MRLMELLDRGATGVWLTISPLQAAGALIIRPTSHLEPSTTSKMGADHPAFTLAGLRKNNFEFLINRVIYLHVEQWPLVGRWAM